MRPPDATFAAKSSIPGGMARMLLATILTTERLHSRQNDCFCAAGSLLPCNRRIYSAASRMQHCRSVSSAFIT
jgi:hypothetical protein